MDSLRLIRRSMWLASGLCLLKAAVAFASGSLGVLSSALDSLMDVCSSAVNYVSLNIARSPADDEHPYGHGKAEALAGLFQASFITLGGLWLIAESVRRFLRGAFVAHTGWGVAVMLLSTVLSAAHGARVKRAATAEDSNIMRAEGAHFLSDVASNLAIVAALVLVGRTGSALWDLGVTGLAAGYILYLTVPIFARSISELMDEGLPAVTRGQVEALIRGHHPSIVGFHEFRSRQAGGRRYIEFHIEISGVAGFSEAHEIAETLCDRVKENIPNSDVMIHYDPVGAR